MGDHWILNDQGEPVKVDLMTWAKWFEKNHKKRIVAQNEIGGVLVSTVFLGIDHGFGREGPPVLWESMIAVRTTGVLGGESFSGLEDLDMRRYTSRDDAVKGHREMVEKATKMAREADALLKEVMGG